MSRLECELPKRTRLASFYTLRDLTNETTHTLTALGTRTKTPQCHGTDYRVITLIHRRFVGAPIGTLPSI